MSTASKMQHHEPGVAAMTPLKGFLTLIAVVVVIALFLALCHFAGVTQTWAAFVFLLYWGGLQHASTEQLSSSVMGAIVGLLMAYLLQQSTGWFGPSGGMVFLGAVLVLVYFQIMGWLSVAVNMCAMFYLTVGTIPQVQADFNFIGAIVALIVGVAYFAGLMWMVKLFQKPKLATA